MYFTYYDRLFLTTGVVRAEKLFNLTMIIYIYYELQVCIYVFMYSTCSDSKIPTVKSQCDLWGHTYFAYKSVGTFFILAQFKHHRQSLVQK